MSTSKRERWLRNANVCPGQRVVLLPNLSRYQLAQPPVVQTVGFIRSRMAAVHSSWAAAVGSIAASRSRRMVRAASTT